MPHITKDCDQGEGKQILPSRVYTQVWRLTEVIPMAESPAGALRVQPHVPVEEFLIISQAGALHKPLDGVWT